MISIVPLEEIHISIKDDPLPVDVENFLIEAVACGRLDQIPKDDRTALKKSI